MAQLDPLFWVSQGCNQSVGWNVLIWRFTFRQEVESCPNLLRLLKELISLWLYGRGLKCFTHGCLRPLSCPRRCLPVLETTCNSLSGGLPNMDVQFIRPARRICSSGQLGWDLLYYNIITEVTSHLFLPTFSRKELHTKTRTPEVRIPGSQLRVSLPQIPAFSATRSIFFFKYSLHIKVTNCFINGNI